MSRFLQEMFWAPSETVVWVRKVALEFGLWIAMWRPGSDAHLILLDDVTVDAFQSAREDALHLFLGRPGISEPKWREVADKRLVDFQRSYAVQLVPSITTPDHKTLLQGRLAILRPDQYDNSVRVEQLISLYRSLRSSMVRDSDRSRVITQLLATGERKRWKSILVGKGVPDGGALRLKQFVNGEVVFDLDAA